MAFLAAALSAAVSGAPGCGHGRGTFDEAKVSRGAVAQTIQLDGTVAYERSFAARPSFSGRLQTVEARQGQHVEKGAILASMDASDARLDMYRKEAAVVRAKRALSKLPDQQADKELEQLELKIATEELAKARLALGRAVIRAPFDGVVVQVNAQPGDLAHPTSPPILLLVDPTSSYLDLEGDQFDAGSVELGSHCLAQLEDAVRERAYPCHIVEGATNRRGRAGGGAGMTLSLKARLDRPATKLIPGLAVRVQVVVARRDNVPIVPMSAVLRRRAGHAVIAREGGALRLVEVSPGLADHSMVELVKGPPDGTVVLSGSSEALRQLADQIK